MIRDQHFEETATAYVLGALSPEETAAFEKEMALMSFEQRAFIKEMMEASMLIGLDTPSVPIPVGMKQRVLGKANVSTTSNWWAIAAMLLFIVTVGLGIVMNRQQTVIEQQQVRLQQVEDELAAKEALLAVLGGRDVHLVTLDNQQNAPGGYANLIWDGESGQAMMRLAALPKAPTGKTYQLWILTSGNPISAGVFSVSESTSETFLLLQDLALHNQLDINGFAVSIEPEGGVPQPTGEIILVGLTSA